MQSLKPKIFWKVHHKCHLYQQSQSNNCGSWTNDHLHSSHRLPLEYIQRAACVMNSALYVDKAGCSSNGKIIPGAGDKIDTTVFVQSVSLITQIGQRCQRICALMFRDFDLIFKKSKLLVMHLHPQLLHHWLSCNSAQPQFENCEVIKMYNSYVEKRLEIASSNSQTERFCTKNAFDIWKHITFFSWNLWICCFIA